MTWAFFNPASLYCFSSIPTHSKCLSRSTRPVFLVPVFCPYFFVVDFLIFIPHPAKPTCTLVAQGLALPGAHEKDRKKMLNYY